MRVRLPGRGRYVYPDVTIVCGAPALEGERDILLNPKTIIEVLSPSTAAFDRGDKFIAYRSIASLDEVVFVSQHDLVECYTRQSGDSWLLREYRDEHAAIVLTALSTPLPLRLVYDGVELEG